MRKRFTKAQYAQMYLGEFIEGAMRLFTDKWIDNACTIKDPKNHKPTHTAVLGVDIAGLGDDESTFEGLERIGDNIIQFHHETTTKTLPTQTEDKIKDINVMYDLHKIGIDSGGMGIGVLAHLLREDSTRRKVVGLDNSKLAIDAEDATKKLQKEAMYYNFLELGLRGKLQLFNTPEIRASLRSVIVEDNGKVGGRYAHIVEGLIRAAELLKSKSIKPYIMSA